jgi:hypothetical protein
VPLARIARALEGDGFTLKDAVTAQLEAVDAELLHARRLERILEVLERSDDPSVEELTQITEVMRLCETFNTPLEQTLTQSVAKQSVRASQRGGLQTQ